MGCPELTVFESKDTQLIESIIYSPCCIDGLAPTVRPSPIPIQNNIIYLVVTIDKPAACVVCHKREKTISLHPAVLEQYRCYSKEIIRRSIKELKCLCRGLSVICEIARDRVELNRFAQLIGFKLISVGAENIYKYD